VCIIVAIIVIVVKDYMCVRVCVRACVCVFQGSKYGCVYRHTIRSLTIAVRGCGQLCNTTVTVSMSRNTTAAQQCNSTTV